MMNQINHLNLEQEMGVEINDEARDTYSPNKRIKFKTSMLRSSLCDYSDAYILVKGKITVNNTAADGVAANNTNKKVIFKNCASFTNYISSYYRKSYKKSYKKLFQILMGLILLIHLNLKTK